MTKRGHVRLRGVTKSFADVPVLRGTDLEVQPGEFFALLGPSGSGKTTTLRILAGLEVATEGHVEFDGQDVTLAPPGERDVAMVFQSYALYPHMSVAENIGFPLRMVGTPGSAIAAAVREAAERVKIAHLLDRRPGQLSGGQQQRVALARAIVRKPALFLLDEPLSNLDAKLRVETRVELKRLQRALDTTTVYVTHDQEEAMSIADRMAVFMNGEMVQVGAPADVFARPATVDVAAFLGNPPMNLLPAAAADGVVRVDGLPLPFLDPRRLGPEPVVLGVRPGDVRLGPEGVPATVTLCEHLGDDVVADLALGDRLLRARTPVARRPREGDAVRVSFDWDAVHLFSAATGRRLELHDAA